MLTTARRAALAAATLILISLANPALAYADTPLEAFCTDNAYALKRSMGETLFEFGFGGAGDIDTLYHMVIDQGAPAITSHWSNLTASVQWRCEGQ